MGLPRVAVAVPGGALPDRKKYVRLFSSEASEQGGRHDWYSAKKAAFVCVVLAVVLITHAWLAKAPTWLSLGVPALLAMAGFWLSGRIRLRFGTSEEASTNGEP